MARALAAVVVLLTLGPIGTAQWSATEEAELFGSDSEAEDSFGFAVAVDGDTAVVGAPLDDHGLGAIEEVSALAFDSASNTLYGADFRAQRFLTIDPVTGLETAAYAAYAPRRALAVDPGTGTLYYTLFSYSSPWSLLYSYVPATNGLGWVATLTGYTSVDALAFDPTAGLVYGVDALSDALITVDPTTGVVAAVGSLGASNVQGLAFDPGTNTLFACDASADQLLVIDTATAAPTAVGPIGFSAVEGLAFDSATNTLFGSDTATNQLLAIDTATGAGSSIATVTGPLWDAGSAYVFARSGTVWVEQAKLTVSRATHLDLAGYSTAISGDTIVLGTPGQEARFLYPGNPTEPGAARVFVRSGTTWSQQATLRASDGAVGDFLGASVALEGDTLLIGASVDDHSGATDAGSVYAFRRTGTVWVEQHKLVAADADSDDWFGSAVALSGDWAVVGAPFNGEGGYVYFFQRSGTTWVQRKRFAEPSRWSRLGASVALADDRALVGAPAHDHGSASYTGFGAVRAFRRHGNVWSEHTKIEKLVTNCEYESFGFSLALSGDRALISRPAGVCEGGTVQLFTPQATRWVPKAKLVASSPGVGLSGRDGFGASVAASGDTVVVGAPQLPGPNGEGGAAYVHRLDAPAPTPYCTAGTSASGCQATISAAGTPSASAASGFLLMASGVEGASVGLFLYGGNGRRGAAWGNGTSFLCVAPPTNISGPLPSSGTPGACDGSFRFDLNARWCPTCPRPGHNRGAGTVVQAQLWYRDLFSTSNKTTSLSDALELWVAP